MVIRTQPPQPQPLPHIQPSPPYIIVVYLLKTLFQWDPVSDFSVRLSGGVL